jgi:F-type H+-transporting ATPase subunit beta
LIINIAKGHGGFLPPGGERRARRPILHGDERGGVIDQKDLSKSKVALVYGQMNEPPGARLRVALSALAMTEYFRDERNQDVLLFIDNIFRFSQAGSEVSALLGRTPSAVGYQPTLSAEMGDLQERITSTNKGSITSFQAVTFRPTTGPTRRSQHLRASRFHHCARALDRRAGNLSGGRSARFDLEIARARVWVRTTPSPAASKRCSSAKGFAGHHRDSRHGRTGASEDRVDCLRARKIQRFLSQPFHVAEVFTGTAGQYVSIAETVRGFKEILDGKHDDVAEQNFYMKGGIDMIKE